MRVIILGAGQVGYSIARYLAFEDNDVTLVDQSPELLKKISDKIDVKPVQGFASHPDVLLKANAADADIIIAVTGSDEVNMIACEVANSLFHIKTKIARIRHRSYLNSNWSGMFHPHRLSIDVIISPEAEVAKSLSRSTEILGATDVIPLVQDRIKIIGIRCRDGAPILNTPLRLIPSLFSKFDIAVLCIVRKESVIFPTKNDVILADDEVHFLVQNENARAAMMAFGFRGDESHNMVIIGGGSIGLRLAQEIEEKHRHISLKIIERDSERSEYVASQLQHAHVLLGDALDQEVLTEAGIRNSETVIALTDDDKVNILSSLMARQIGATRTLTLLNNMNYSGLVTSLGVDAVVNPRSITVSTILQHIRQGRMQSIHSLGDGYAEIIEAEATETSHIIGLSTDDITIRNAIFIACIVRGPEVILMPRKILISVGDQLVIVAHKDAVKKVEKLFSIRPSYL